MDEPKHKYLLRLMRWGAPAGQLGDEPAGPVAAGVRPHFWSDYTLDSGAAPLAVADGNRAVAWLVAAERLCSPSWQRWGRAVAVDLVEGEPFGPEANVYTFLPELSPARPGGPFGLRTLGTTSRVFSGMRGAYTMLHIVRNRRKGSAWVKYLPASVGIDDLLTTPARAAARPGRRQFHGLNDKGTAAEFCWPWVWWCWQQVPHLDTASEVARDGTLTPAGRSTEAPMLAGVTTFNKLMRWHWHRSPALRALDELREKQDAAITAALRAHGTAEYSQPWLRSAQGHQPFGGEREFLACGLLWADWCELLGFSVSGQARVGPLDRMQIWDTRLPLSETPPGTMHLSLVQDAPRYGYPQFYEPPAPGTRPRLQAVPRRAELLGLCKRLLSLTQWFYRERVDFHGIWGFGVRGFEFDSQGRHFHTVAAPQYGPYIPPGPDLEWYGNITLAQYNAIPWEQRRMLPNGYYSYPFEQDRSMWRARQLAVVEYERYEQLEDWGFSIINALTMLELIVAPERERKYLPAGRAMMVPPHRAEPPLSPTAESMPEAFEMVPYIWHGRTQRGPWIDRPSMGRHSNVAAVVTPPPPKPTAQQLAVAAEHSRARREEREYEQRREAARRRLNGLVDGWLEYDRDLGNLRRQVDTHIDLRELDPLIGPIIDSTP